MKIIENDYKLFLQLLTLLGISPLGKPNTICYDGESEFCKEMQLKPTKKHLLALIDYLSKKDGIKAEAKGEDRKKLFYGDSSARKEACEKAKDELMQNYDTLTSASHPWYMFEGYTNPDIFIEGDDYVIVCEGKWTEPHITTNTTYLSSPNESRNQMIRHIQGALNYKNKKVYAFYIVDAACGYLDDLTKENFCKHLDSETISLDGTEKQSIAESYYGFTTWQNVQLAIPDVIFKEKSEIMKSNQ